MRRRLPVPLRRIDRSAASPAPARIRTESRHSVHPVHRPRPTPPKIARNSVTHLLDKPYIRTLLSNTGAATRSAAWEQLPRPTSATAPDADARPKPKRTKQLPTRHFNPHRRSSPLSTIRVTPPSGKHFRVNHQTGRQENGLTLVGTPSLGADPAARRFRPAP